MAPRLRGRTAWPLISCGVMWIRGSPTDGVLKSSSSGGAWMFANGRRDSNLGLRCPGSSCDEVLSDIPTNSATATPFCDTMLQCQIRHRHRHR